ncbi:MAG: hypothetical protein NTV49_14105 [Kiritimatiellaeota bacterium]|nr:hypothetical protein [Kiritimatiellota bacterium]
MTRKLAANSAGLRNSGVLLLFALGLPAWAANPPAADLKLAAELAEHGDPAGAAVEFRRLALGADGARARAAFYWASAFAYTQTGQAELSDKMLDRAEDADPALGPPALLLRAENAARLAKWSEAGFYEQAVLDGAVTGDARRLAARRLAAAHLRRHDLPAARTALEKAGADTPASQALDQYARGRDKSPRLGGWLGVVPGLGYFYAGEPANGLRSLLLNGLFIFGLVNTAQHDEWGAFAVIGFFEITWYTGSIYGGVDASHRYNRSRLDACLGSLSGSFAPDFKQLPAISLRYQF